MQKVAIQGFEGSYHDQATRLFFGDAVEIVPCDTFKALVETVKMNPEILGVIAIENTIAGSLLQNYNLIRDNTLTIVGEHKLRIKHSFAVLPGQTPKDITEVRSHYMALLQCEEFLSQYPWLRLVGSDDTAKSAFEIAQQKLTGVAAICSANSARKFGLEVLADSIETNKHNFTRFLMIANVKKGWHYAKKEECNKASLVFWLPHEKGSLSKVLTILSFYNINLTKIQSLPIVGQEWEYLFYIDVLFDDYHRYQQSLEAIRPLTSNIKILGEYKEGSQTI